MRSFLIVSVVALLMTPGPVAQSRGAVTPQPPQPAVENPAPAGQRPPGRGAGREGTRNPAEAPGLTMNEVQAIVDGWEIASAEKQMQLSDQQYVPFLQQLRKLQDARRRHMMQRQRALMALRQATNQQPAVEDSVIEARTKQLDDHERQSQQEIQGVLTAIDAVLTPRQRARFRLLQSNMERQKLEVLSRAMRAGGGGK